MKDNMCVVFVAKVHDQDRRLLPRRGVKKNHNFFFKDSIFTNDVLYEAQNTTEKEYVSIVGQNAEKCLKMAFFLSHQNWMTKRTIRISIYKQNVNKLCVFSSQMAHI